MCSLSGESSVSGTPSTNVQSSLEHGNQLNDDMEYRIEAMSPRFDDMKNISILEVILAHMDTVILGHGPMLMLFQASCWL